MDEKHSLLTPLREFAGQARRAAGESAPFMIDWVGQDLSAFRLRGRTVSMSLVKAFILGMVAKCEEELGKLLFGFPSPVLDLEAVQDDLMSTSYGYSALDQVRLTNQASGLREDLFKTFMRFVHGRFPTALRVDGGSGGRLVVSEEFFSSWCAKHVVFVRLLACTVHICGGGPLRATELVHESKLVWNVQGQARAVYILDGAVCLLTCTSKPDTVRNRSTYSVHKLDPRMSQVMCRYIILGRQFDILMCRAVQQSGSGSAVSVADVSSTRSAPVDVKLYQHQRPDGVKSGSNGKIRVASYWSIGHMRTSLYF